jgi:hypothetical protein
MRKRLTLLGGMVVLLLYASSAVEAGPLFRSDLVCNPSSGSGFTQVKNNGDLYVSLRGLTTAGGTAQCSIQCNSAAQQTLHISQTCGGQLIRGGNLTTTAPRGSFVPPLSSAFRSVCAVPSVSVLAPGDNCVSGFDIP